MNILTQFKKSKPRVETILPSSSGQSYNVPHPLSYYRKQCSHKIIATQYMTGLSFCQVLVLVQLGYCGVTSLSDS